jgi:hypothetical protein
MVLYIASPLIYDFWLPLNFSKWNCPTLETRIKIQYYYNIMDSNQLNM